MKAELTAVSSFPPVSNCNTQDGTGFGVAAQSNTETLLQIAATVTGSLDASLQKKKKKGFKVTRVCRCWKLAIDLVNI